MPNTIAGTVSEKDAESHRNGRPNANLHHKPRSGTGLDDASPLWFYRVWKFQGVSRSPAGGSTVAEGPVRHAQPLPFPFFD